MLYYNILNIFNLSIWQKMENLSKLKQHQIKLQLRYKELIEQAYNLRQTDSAQSDISEYKAIKLLNKLNRLKYLNRETSKTTIPS